MTNGTIETTITGGRIQGVAGAGTVHIENFTIYNRVVEEPAAADAAAGPIARCPYPGLAYFGPEHADLFFGRDAAIARLAEAVGRQSLTALVGASGSGKSSVVLAGLAPRLHSAGEWRFSHFRIGTELDNNPFLALARSLVPLYVASQSDTDRLLNTKQLAERLETGRLTLRDVFADCRSRNKGTRILLIADQFEEAFTSVEDEGLRNRFIDLLLAGFADPASDGSPDVCLILTLRADFYGQALRHRPLADALQAHVENLGQMNREELQAAIRLPAERAEVSFDPGLVETLLDDVENKPGSLPLLQFALREMWGRQRNARITRRSYDDIGGVEGALAQRAETIFAAMTGGGTDAPTARAFQRLFTRLVTLGEGQEDTRRVVDRAELGDDVWSLAQRLAGEKNRLVVTNAPAFSRETAEVVHEALIRHWPKLVDWIDRDRAFQSWLRQIRSNVELYSFEPSDDGPLLRGSMLAQARDWLARRRDDLSPAELRYIEASLALQQRAEEEREAARQAEIRRQQELAEAAVKLAAEQRRRAMIAATGGITAFTFAFVAVLFGHEARMAQQRADDNARAARTELLAMQARRAEAQASASDVIELGGALALESMAMAGKASRPLEADAVEAARSALVGLPLGVLAHGGGVRSLAVLADGRLASGGADGTIKLWPKGVRASRWCCRTAATGSGRWRCWRTGERRRRRQDQAVAEGGERRAGGAVTRRAGSCRWRCWPTGGWRAATTTATSSCGRRKGRASRWCSRMAARSGRWRCWRTGGWRAAAPTAPSSCGRRGIRASRWCCHTAAARSCRWRCWRTGGWRVAAKTATSSCGRRRGQASRWCCPTAAARSTRWRCWRTGGWPAAAPTAPSSCGRRGYGRAGGAVARPRLGQVAGGAGGRGSGGEDGKIKLWPKEGNGEPVVLSHGGGGVLSLAVLADGRLASGDDDGNVKLWPKEGTGEPLVLAHGSPVWSLAVLADGRLASGGADGTIKLWPKGDTGEPVVLSHGGGALLSLAVLADGRLASGGEDGNIKLWPKEGTGEPMVLPHGGGAVLSLAVLADGRLASGGQDGNIKLWLVDEQKLIAALCLRAGRNLTKAEWARYIGPDTPWQPSCRDRPSNWRTPD